MQGPYEKNSKDQSKVLGYKTIVLQKNTKTLLVPLIGNMWHLTSCSLFAGGGSGYCYPTWLLPLQLPAATRQWPPLSFLLVTRPVCAEISKSDTQCDFESVDKQLRKGRRVKMTGLQLTNSFSSMLSVCWARADCAVSF